MNAEGVRRPQLFVLAGPNGSGKTTWLGYNRDEIAALGLVEHINPDAVAREVSPHDVQSAAIAVGREIIRWRFELLRAHKSFGIETTLAGHHALALMREARSLGYDTTLVFVATDNPDINVARVAWRKSMGGHGIPETDIRRRYARSFENLEAAIRLSETSYSSIIVSTTGRTSSPGLRTAS